MTKMPGTVVFERKPAQSGPSLGAILVNRCASVPLGVLRHKDREGPKPPSEGHFRFWAQKSGQVHRDREGPRLGPAEPRWGAG